MDAGWTPTVLPIGCISMYKGCHASALHLKLAAYDENGHLLTPVCVFCHWDTYTVYLHSDKALDALKCVFGAVQSGLIENHRII